MLRRLAGFRVWEGRGTWRNRVPVVRLCAVLLLLSACTASRQAMAPLEPLRADPSDASGLRAMTYNIRSGRGGLSRVAEVIRRVSPDVVALQEVDHRTRRSHGVDQVAALSEATGLPYHAFFRATQMHGGEYGVAILSRFPILESEGMRLPIRTGIEPRVAGRAVVLTPSGEISIYTTHLTNLPARASIRVLQSRAILSWMKQDSRPTILMGDLNDGGDSAALALLRDSLADAFVLTGTGPAATFPLPSILPDLQLDYVLSSSTLHAVKSFVFPSDASDHHPLIADLQHRPPEQQAAR